jgi:preprotein translocase subunit SecE
MENTNSKIITASFAFGGVILGLTVHLLLKAFASAFGFVARMADYDIVRHGLPIASALILFGVCQFHPKIRAWAEEVVAEVRKVVFPSRKDTTAMTISVIVMVFISSVIITAMDWFSGVGLNALIDLAK